jgi:hypothetical protein
VLYAVCVAGLSGSPLPRMASLFPRDPAVFHRPPSPATFAAGSSSPELRLPFRVLRSVPAPPCSSEAPPLGSPPPLRHQCVESTLASIPSPLRSALRVSHPPDGFLLDPPCGFISPRSHIRGSPFRGFFLRRSRTPSSEAVALLPFHRATYPTCVRRRMRGPGFRALLCVGVRRVHLSD